MSDRDYFEERGYYNEPSDNDYAESRYIVGEKIENTKAVELASELVSIKKNIQRLKYREKEVKEKLKKHIPLHSWVQIGNKWRIEYQIHQSPKTFKRTDVLEYLRSNLGEPVANSVDETCTNSGERKPAIYVISINKRAEQYVLKDSTD